MSYNHEPFIETCLRSVLLQHGEFNLEVLVGVDLSSDRTAEIVTRIAAEEPDVVKPFIHRKRIGFGSINYQSLLREVSGEFVAHLDGDDFWHPTKLQRQLEFLVANPQCNAVYTNALVVDRHGTCQGVFGNKQPVRFRLDYLLERGSFLPQSSMMYRATVLDQVCQISPPYIDYYFSLVLANNGDAGYINDTLVSYRWDSTHSVRRSMNEHLREQMWRAISSFEPGTVSELSLLKAKSEFLRSAFYRSLKLRQAWLLKKWWVEVAGSVTGSRMKLLYYTAVAIIRQGGLEFWSLLSSILGHARGRVYYRR